LERIKTDQKIVATTIPSFAEADSSLAARLLSRFKQIDSICFQICKGQLYPYSPYE